MSAELARAKARYADLRGKAYLRTAQILVPHIEVDFTITQWGAKAKDAYSRQWGQSRFDWEEIFRKHNDPDRLDMAIWSPNDRLSALCLGLTTGRSVHLRFLEGDRREDCPLKGRRILIVLEAAANFAQGRGKSELRLQPESDALKELFRETYGFALEKDQDKREYWVKRI